jgi:hypothetical protein
MTDYRVSHDVVSGDYFVVTIKDGIHTPGTYHHPTREAAEAAIIRYRAEDEARSK